MANVLDTTIGGNTSNSYGTIEEALSYFGTRSDAVSFSELSEQEQIDLLIYATIINDLLLYPVGEEVSDNQSLLFPRKNLVDKKGKKYSEDEIPIKIKYAQFEQALHLNNNSIKIPSLMTQGFSEARLDVMSIKVDKTMLPNKLDSDAVDFLSQFGMIESASVSGFKQVNVFRY